MTPRPPLHRKSNTVNPVAAATDALSAERLRDRFRGFHWAICDWTTLNHVDGNRLLNALVVPNSADVDVHFELVNEVARLSGAIDEELLP